ncbi:hypothetical protein KXR87_16070 [Yokenella regensburgei]|uniref:hypothetical protein n=1 Tax=Yokenella regensburgei TaxID=158877 RepID=UPI003F1586E2
MSIKDVSSMASIRSMPVTRQEAVRALTGKETGLADAYEVSLSREAMEQAKEQPTPPTKEEQDAAARAMQALRNQAMARTPGGPSLASEFYGDPATANDAVRFLDFFQHATVAADAMAEALHSALTSPSDSGDYTTNAMDLALTQGKLNKVVETWISADYHQEARAFVSQFIDEKSAQADQLSKVALSQATKLAQSLGDREQARHHQDAVAQLAEGTHSSQRVRNEMLNLTATSSDSELWFSSMSQWVNDHRALPYMADIEKNHIGALKAQWQTFVDSLKKEA